MFSQKGHKITYLKLSISLVLSILFTYNTWNGLVKPFDSVNHSGLSPFDTISYVYINSPQPPTINSWIPILNSSKFNFFNNYYKELVQTRLLDQIIAISEKIEFATTIIKPPGFYNYFAKRETDEDPVLS
jgi:hypothetical protein